MPSDPATGHLYLDIIKETLLLISESIPLPALFIKSWILRHVLWGKAYFSANHFSYCILICDCCLVTDSCCMGSHRSLFITLNEVGPSVHSGMVTSIPNWL